MKKTIVILSIILSLFSLSSCNLDNEGILWRNIDRTVSDNKNRNFIGATDDAFYFVTENGLEKGTVNGDSYSETVVSNNDIFAQFYQGFGFIYGTNIIYLDDVAGNNQTFYKIDLTNNYTITPLECPQNEVSFKDFYVTNSGTYIVGVGSNGNPKIFSVSLNADTLELTDQSTTDLSQYHSSFNGLIYDGSNYYYEGNVVTLQNEDGTSSEFKNASVRSFATNGTDSYIISNDGSNFTFYKNVENSESSGLTVKNIGSVSGSYRNPFTSFVNADGLLYIVDANSTNSSSTFITVSYDSSTEKPFSYTTAGTLNGIEAEAFFTLKDSTYMLSKNHGLFRVENTSLVKL